jgi:molecular chaperone GrpE
MSDADPFRGTDRLLAAIDVAGVTADQKAKHRRETSRLLLGFLEVLDGLEALAVHCQELVAQGNEHVPHRTAAHLAEKMGAVFTQAGVRSVLALGQPLDLRVHAVVDVRPGSAADPDTILEESQRGYFWHDELLRPARVVIAGPAGSDLQQAEGSKR